MDYDRNIHHNPDAIAWAKFFVETTKDMGREVFCDEGYMVGWFANAMMAMHDSMKPHEAADEIEQLRDELDFQLHKRKEETAEIERLRKVVTLLIEYEEHDENIYKGAEMWEALIEAAHAALKEKE